MNGRVLLVLVAATCCHGLTGKAGETTAQPRTVTVVAIAGDAQAVVVRDSQGAQHRYKAGDKIAGSDWSVERIANGHVLLRSSRRFAGESLRQRAKAGDRLHVETPTAPVAKPTPHPVIVHAIPRYGQQGKQP